MDRAILGGVSRSAVALGPAIEGFAVEEGNPRTHLLLPLGVLDLGRGRDASESQAREGDEAEREKILHGEGVYGIESLLGGSAPLDEDLECSVVVPGCEPKPDFQHHQRRDGEVPLGARGSSRGKPVRCEGG